MTNIGYTCFVIFLCLFPSYIQAGISLPPFGNVTYAREGSNVTLQWTYDFKPADVAIVQWFFTKNFESNKLPLAIIRNDVVTIVNKTLPNTNVIKPATLVLNNVSKDHNGTYLIEITLALAPVTSSEVQVIFTVPTDANTSCDAFHHLDEGKNFSCICTGKGGSPPPTAWWIKNDTKLGTISYLYKELILTSVSKSHNGTYVCRAQSGNLIDEERIEVTVFYKPHYAMLTSNATNNEAKLGNSIMLTCDADGNPSPYYLFSFNGTTLENSTSGVYIIQNANFTHNGTYTCHAINRLGSTEANLFIHVEEVIAITTKPTTISGSSTGNSTETTSTKASTGGSDESSDSKVPLIAGIVVGVLVITILIVAIWWCFFRGSRRGKEREHVVQRTESGASQSAGFAPRGENPYESVDGYKENENAEDGGAGSSVNNAPADSPRSSMPPVYAVVDKSKKKPKKEDALTYASLDPVALQPDSSKMRVRDHKETDYAAIDLDKLKKNDV